MAIAPMGVIKAGAAYQPLDPTYPKDRLMYMLEDSAAKLLIADRELLPLVDGYQGPVLFTDEIPQLESVMWNLRSQSFMICLFYCTLPAPPAAAERLYAGIWKYHCILPLVQKVLPGRSQLQNSSLCVLWI